MQFCKRPCSPLRTVQSPSQQCCSSSVQCGAPCIVDRASRMSHVCAVCSPCGRLGGVEDPEPSQMRHMEHTTRPLLLSLPARGRRDHDGEHLARP